MIYNVVLYSKLLGKTIVRVTGFDGRPLKFTDYRYAEAAVNDFNSAESMRDNEDMQYRVIEDKGD
jgi:hypothetical protein